MSTPVDVGIILLAFHTLLRSPLHKKDYLQI